MDNIVFYTQELDMDINNIAIIQSVCEAKSYKIPVMPTHTYTLEYKT